MASCMSSSSSYETVSRTRSDAIERRYFESHSLRVSAKAESGHDNPVNGYSYLNDASRQETTESVSNDQVVDTSFFTLWL